MNKTLGILGYGYTAQVLASKLVKQGYTIHATSRTLVPKEKHSDSIQLYDFNQGAIEKIVSACSSILICIPPTTSGADPVLDHFNSIFIKQAKTLDWVGYLSSTAVYGDHQGQWVTENTEPHAPGRSGVNRLTIEAQWMDIFNSHKVPSHIFRIAGIYGPKRNSLERILTGKPFSVYKPEQVFSRIHIEDICQALALSLAHPTPGEIYNLCDDLPAPSHEVDEFAATLLNKPKPKLVHYESAELSPMGMEFYRCNKRVSNQKIKSALEFKPLFPTYKEGLVGLVGELYV
jgi:nucleoside-diphosphate-sugar epimerase